MQETAAKTKYKGKLRAAICIMAFVVMAAALFLYLNKVFSMGDDDANRQTFKAFYSEEPNTIEVAYLGTSAANRFFINPQAYHDEGIASFTVATMGMPMFFIPEVIDEVEKTQDPKLYIIELRWFLKSKDDINDAHIRRVTDNLKYSRNKFGSIDKAFTIMDGDTGELGDISYNKVDYLVPVVKYHDRLTQHSMRRGDWKLTSTKNKTKGFILSDKTRKQVNQFPARLTPGEAPMSELAEESLNEVLDYCDQMKGGADILFVLSPYSVKTGQMPVFNTVIEKVEKRGYQVLNFNTKEMYEELDLDWDKDYYDSMHVNYLGAEKYTAWLSKYLKSNYALEDYRGDARYESWEDAYREYKEYVKDGINVIGHKDKIGGKVTIIYDSRQEQNND